MYQSVYIYKLTAGLSIEELGEMVEACIASIGSPGLIVALK